MQQYVGQWLKDYFRLPRPAVVAPKLVRVLEGVYHAEYGAPSTHTMSILGQGLTLVFFTYQENYNGHDDYPLTAAVVLALVVTFNTALSRVYMGMHSVVDLTTGAIIGLIVLWLMWGLQREVDALLTENPATLWTPTAIALILLATYARPREFTSAYVSFPSGFSSLPCYCNRHRRPRAVP